MVKKAGVKKKKRVRSSKTKKTPEKILKLKTPIISSKQIYTEKILIENFIALQKVITNLSIKFDKLTNQISSLLELFEVSAKTLAEKDFNIKKENRNNKDVVEKIDNLLEQNKIIAKGVALVHEGQSGNKPTYPPQRIMQRPIPKPTDNRGGYQKSISQKSPQTTEFKQLKRN